MSAAKRTFRQRRRPPLESRRGFGRRGSGLKRRSRRIESRPEIDQLEQEGCWPGQFFSDPCQPGLVDPCHVGIDQQTLKAHWDDQERRRSWGLPYNRATLRVGRAEFVWDPRWIRKGCRHHHSSFDGPHFKLTRAQIPASVEEAAEEYGLSARLTRDYGPRPKLIERGAA